MIVPGLELAKRPVTEFNADMSRQSDEREQQKHWVRPSCAHAH
jgi:hypothetical protein